MYIRKSTKKHLVGRIVTITFFIVKLLYWFTILIFILFVNVIIFKMPFTGHTDPNHKVAADKQYEDKLRTQCLNGAKMLYDLWG